MKINNTSELTDDLLNACLSIKKGVIHRKRITSRINPDKISCAVWNNFAEKPVMTDTISIGRVQFRTSFIQKALELGIDNARIAIEAERVEKISKANKARAKIFGKQQKPKTAIVSDFKEKTERAIIASKTKSKTNRDMAALIAQKKPPTPKKQPEAVKPKPINFNATPYNWDNELYATGKVTNYSDIGIDSLSVYG